MIRRRGLNVTEFVKKLDIVKKRVKFVPDQRIVDCEEKIEGRNSVRKRSAQLHVRCREAKNSANR